MLTAPHGARWCLGWARSQPGGNDRRQGRVCSRAGIHRAGVGFGWSWVGLWRCRFGSNAMTNYWWKGSALHDAAVWAILDDVTV